MRSNDAWSDCETRISMNVIYTKRKSNIITDIRENSLQQSDNH